VKVDISGVFLKQSPCFRFGLEVVSKVNISWHRAAVVSFFTILLIVFFSYSRKTISCWVYQVVATSARVIK